MSRLLTYCFPSSCDDWPQRVSFLLLAAGVSLVLVSIAASAILLAFAILAAILQWRRCLRGVALPSAILWPLALLFLWTVAATLLGSGSLRDGLIVKFWLYSLLLIVPIFAGGEGRIRWIYHALFAVATVSACAGVAQFLANPNRDDLNRIKGFMSIWMTYAGSLMLISVALAAYVVIFGWKNHRWVIPLGLVLAAALYLSKTRNAWVGTVLGLVVILLLMRRYRVILGLIVVLLALYLVSPANIQQRLRAGFSPADINTRNRIELFGTSLRLIRAHPWIGVGQRVSLEAPHYRGTSEFPDWMYLHMHNNILQIAAERGIPGLILWLWFMLVLGWQAFKAARSAGGSAVAAFAGLAAIGGWVAMMAAGMFEYNIGDSEPLTVFLFMMSAPYAARVIRAES